MAGHSNLFFRLPDVGVSSCNGGLASSFLFTLFLVPCVYLIVEEIKQRFLRKKQNSTV